MNAPQTLQLFEDFPELYRGRLMGIKKNLMCFGFCCGDGWFELVYDLSREIMEHCAASGDPVPLAVQVKEKFGALRFYTDNATDAVQKIIDEYEKKSLEICEITGAPGGLCARGNWRKTLCDEQAWKLGYERCGSGA